jgi:hypothetical protein
MRIGDPLLQRAMAGGSPVLITGTGLLARGAGMTGVAAVAAPIVTMGGMALDEAFFGADYPGLYYEGAAARSSLSGGAGAGAGFLTTAGIFALGGSEFPIIGNIIGFGVGTIVYLVVDVTAGEALEQSILESGGAYGCVGTPFAGVRPTE